MDWTNLSSEDVLESMDELGTWPWAGPSEAEDGSEGLPLHTLSIALTVAVGSGRGPDVSPRSLSHCRSQAEQTSLNGAVPTAPQISSVGQEQGQLPVFPHVS